MNLSDPARQKLAIAPFDLRFAVLFAPREQREVLTALFAVYLEIREILQECNDSNVALAKLGWWREEIGLFIQNRPRHPLSINLLRFTNTQPLPSRPFLDIIESVHTDIAKPALPHFEDVERYCQRRGGALLKLAALLAGAQQATTLEAARQLGLTWQLAEIALTGMEHAQHGRIYFAADDLHKHGVDRHIVGGAHTDTGIRALLADYAQRARAFRNTAMADLSTEKQTLSSSLVLNGLAQTRLRKFARLDYNPGVAPLELRPLVALYTAWQSARNAAR